MYFAWPVTQALLLRVLFTFIVLLHGANAHATENLSSDMRNAQRYLERARESARRLDYTGIVLHQQGPESQTSRVTHAADDSGGIVHVQPMEGPSRDMVRKGPLIVWYLPHERLVIHDQSADTPGFPSLSFNSASQLLTHYHPSPLEASRVAGRDAALLVLRPVDGLRYGYRLWFDVATGLLLRAQSISEAGQVVAQTGFSQLAVWPASGKRFRWHEPNVRGWTIQHAVTGKADVAGWSFRLPEGFSQVSALRRITAKLPDSQGESREVLQIVCSDGLAGISIFIEPWSAAQSTQPVQRGAVNMLGKRLGRFWLTIVGETPMAALRQVADSIQFTAPAPK